jgi:hypothetical protein
MDCDKHRIRFTKAGDLRLVSHHDLMRCFERMLRRAALPFRSTGGFHPTPRLVFALSLPLGVAGLDEVAELELTEPVGPDEVHRRLAEQAPPGLEVLSVRRVEAKATARVRRAFYRVKVAGALPPTPTLPRKGGGSEEGPAAAEVLLPPPLRGRVGVGGEQPPPPDDLPARVAALLARPAVWVERLRPQPRRVDIRPYIDDLRLRGGALEMDLWVTPTGTARADEVMECLGLGEWLRAGAVPQRTGLEIEDELTDPQSSGPAAVVPRAGPPVFPTGPAEGEVVRPAAPPPPAAPATWGASPNGPVLE